jgi:hypothetical protein
LFPREHPLSWLQYVKMGGLTFGHFRINAHQIKCTCCVCCSNSTSNFTSCSRSPEHTITTSSVSMITRSCTPITATNRLSPKTRVFLVSILYVAQRTHYHQHLWVVSSAERPKPGSGASRHDDCVIHAHTP